VDLRDLAVRHGDPADFAKQLAALREAHASKRTFCARLAKAGL